MFTRSKPQYCFFPFALVDKTAGGLPSVFLKEVNSGRELILFTSDRTNYCIKNARILATSLEGCDFGQLTRFWYGVGCWQWLHPDAFTDATGDRVATRLMLELSEGTPEVTFDMLNDYCHKNTPKDNLDHSFNECFDRHIEGIVPNSVVNWQDYFFVPSVLKHSERLRRSGVFQTFHLHTSLPASLYDSGFGRDLLRAMSYVDTVYLHTDEYILRAEEQMRKLKLSIPKLRRFDLGIDREMIDESVDMFNGNALTVRNAIDELPDGEEKTLIEDAIRTRDTVPHRFINIDRVDPSKGNVTVIKAVIKFLESRLLQGESREEMLAKYRFYFIQANLNKPFDPSHLKNGWYAKYLRELLNRVTEQFKGIIFASDALSGNHRKLIPALMVNASGLTGGAQDGLNLAIQENIYVNREKNTSAVCGDGAGFSMHVRSLGLEKYAFFPRAGDVTGFANSINEIVNQQSRSREILIHWKKPLVEHIKARDASVIVDN
jgi:hypothetical protein